MAWDGPILTDSGGFQVFSLRHTADRVDDDGVWFRSVYDGSRHRFTPELAMAVQRSLGSDIAMAFDECTRADVEPAELAAAVRRTSLWARRSREAEMAPGQLVFGISQGATDMVLRERSVADILDIGFDGYAIGGLSVGEERSEMLRTVSATTAMMPAGPAPLPHGDRRPGGRGRDDLARRGHVRLRAAHAARPHRRRAGSRRADQPAQRPRSRGTRRRWSRAARARPARRFSRAYIRHLITQEEIVGLRLLTLHNLHTVIALTQTARESIIAGRFAAFRESEPC